MTADYDPLALPAQPEAVEDVERFRLALEGIAATDLSRDGSADLCYCRWFVGVAKQALEHTTAPSPVG